MIRLLTLTFPLILIASQTGYIEYGRFVPLQPTAAKRSETTRYFVTPDNRTIGVMPQILVKLYPECSIKTVSRQFNVKQTETLAPRLYLLHFNPDEDVLSHSIVLSHHPDVQYAHPNFKTTKQLR